MSSKMKNKFKKQMFVHAKNLESDVQSSSQPSSSSFIDPAQYKVNGEFTFKVPPEAPVFEPTIEEFLDPLAYIHKIKPLAERTGICKVKPPSEWHPPFAVDVDRFKFTPRVQKLNELDANTRVRLYFLDRLATFWNCSGIQIRIPAVNDKTLDMYSLYKIVEMEGGFDVVNADKKWTKVASRMGYINEKVVAPTLKFHYKRLLLAYDKFEKGKKVVDVTKEKNNGKIDIKKEPDDSPVKPANDVSTKRRTRSNYTDNDTEILVSETFKDPVIQDKNKELQRLTFYGPGPKILGSNKRKDIPHQMEESATYICIICKNGESEESILLCDGCDDGYHTFCLTPALTSIPKGDWRCSKCIVDAVNKPNDSFGFEQAERDYTLQQFGEMADQFKSNYFNMPVHLVPTEKVEHEYWRILSSLDSSVTVEYGADLHSMDHGSGFPTYLALKESGDDNNYYKSYVESSWNLNNIPVLEGSVLGYINADISGMKIPWMYVGMCFSTFCWHNEDHWSYSINYLHWGEPKTWYGVPGSKAEEFEKVMQETTPDLFYHQPDLLHQLVTNLNPNILMDKGVPVYHIDQAAGEFVLTFPRAYHAGFNHGYNFAEAVNFAPVDWIPLGRLSVEHYSSLHRYCVFSHDELICKMASLPDNLNSTLATAAYDDMIKMLHSENKQRKALLEWGVINAEREAFELLADDERQCSGCNTTCFLSAVTCKCSPKKVTCLRHFKTLCDCPPLQHTLRYRYTLDELPLMLDKLKEKSDSVSVWAAKVHDALDITTPRTITLSGLKDLLNEAHEKHFPDDPSLNLLSDAIKSVQDALVVDFTNILSSKSTLPKKVKIVEIEHYYGELKRIPCVLPQENTVNNFLNFINDFRKNVNSVINDENARVEDLEELLKQGNFPNIEIPEVETLKSYLHIQKWLEEYNRINKHPGMFTLENLNKLLRSGSDITHIPTIKEKMKHLAEINQKTEHLENTSERYLTVKSTSVSKPLINDLQELLHKADQANIFLSNKKKICSVIKNSLRWKSIVNDIFSNKHAPFLPYVEDIIQEGTDSIVYFEEIKKLQTLVDEVKMWKYNIRKYFLKGDSPLSLLEVLTPRKSTPGVYNPNSEINSNADDIMIYDMDLDMKSNAELEDIMTNIKVAEKREMELILSLRVKNVYKRMNNYAQYCICSSSYSESLDECTLCRELFHPSCLENIDYNNESEYKLPLKLLCVLCRRSKRPSLDMMVKEINKLKRFRIHLIEGEALCRLVERAIEWKKEVDKTLTSNNEIASAVFILSQTDKSAITNENEIHITLNEGNRCILKKLLIRGDVIELCLPDNYIIWKLLKYSQLNANSMVVNTDADLVAKKSNLNNSHLHFAMEHIKSELKYETFYFKNEILSSVISCKGKKRKTFTGKLTQKGDASDITSLHEGNSADKMKTMDGEVSKPNIRSTRRTNNATKLQKKYVEDNTESDTEEEISGLCDMKNCVEPDSNHVDWVQCDCCKSWFHMVCVGVTKNEMASQTEFMCYLCMDLKNPFPSTQGISDSILKHDEPDNIIVVNCSTNFSS